MYARGLFFLVSLSLLGACSGVEPRPDTQQAVLSDRLGRLITDYNARHHTQVEMPALSIADDARPAMIASADYSAWSIRVNRLWLKKDPCLVFKEAMAHELAHLLVDYRKYGEPRAATMLTRSGPVVVAFNGPPDLQDASEEHGREWQAMALELGAHPCEEGYCRSEHPYSKSPLSCTAAEYAIMHALPPAAPVKRAPPAQVAKASTSWTSSRTLFDSQAGGQRR